MKNKEIERKFLIDKSKLPDLSEIGYDYITQYYLPTQGTGFIYRLRMIIHFNSNNRTYGCEHIQTIKGSGNKISDEYEIYLMEHQFKELLPLCKDNRIDKLRYEIYSNHSNHKIYLDIFKLELSGLYIAEVEFDSEEEADNYIPEDWFGEEVTENSNYSNFKLAINGKQERT